MISSNMTFNEIEGFYKSILPSRKPQLSAVEHGDFQWLRNVMVMGTIFGRLVIHVITF